MDVDFDVEDDFSKEFYKTLEEMDSHDFFPHNGTGQTFVQRCPVHNYEENEIGREFYEAPEGLVQRLVVQDSQRLKDLHLLLNRVVYDSIDPSPINKKSSNGPYYLPSKNDTTLVFESRFENGNMRRSIQVYEYEYDLILKFDVNTRSHTQWFYFSVDNVRTGVKYKFNMINFLKKSSLYNEGMKPLIYSEERAAKTGVGWFRGGFEIGYYQNSIKRKGGYFYTMTFSYVFENKGKHYFSYCYPYTYTDLKIFLQNMERNPLKRNLFRRRTLCQTLAGNNVDLLTITSFIGNTPSDLKKRKGVVITARVHPGESNSSWAMKGIIEFLTSTSIDAQILRDNFVFKIIPMLNPDGVINGNYRCSLAGSDLNRKWDSPSKKLHPTIYHAKLMMKQFQRDNEIVLFCDLHGHSRKKNIFSYGCYKGKTRKERLRTRIFPMVLWRVSKHFSYSDCNWNMSRKKESSARMVVFKELHIVNAFTIEASFCGGDFGRSANKHYTTIDFEKQGHSLLEAILDFCDPDKTRVNQVVKELDLLYPSIDNLNEEDDDVGSDDESDSEQIDKPTKKKKKAKSKSSEGSVKVRKGKNGENIGVRKKAKSPNEKHSGVRRKKTKGDKKKRKKDKYKETKNGVLKSKRKKKLKRRVSTPSPVGSARSSARKSSGVKKKKKKSITPPTGSTRGLNPAQTKKKKKKVGKKKKKRKMDFFESYNDFRDRLFKKADYSGAFNSEVVFTNIEKKFVENYVSNQTRLNIEKGKTLPKLPKRKKKRKR